ncbi:hypothetical protein NMY22_g4508 [Coprinellus aureogranulatus]|nr:hypothetical protein NMY22_g4508 [Coprinellus aureogranulatus]
MPNPKFQTKEGKQIDKFLRHIGSQVEDGDAIIPLFGPSGCGKSTFIDRLVLESTLKRPKVGSGSSSITQTCEVFVVEGGPFRRNSDYKKLPGRLLVVDTPGFHNSHLSDEKVATDIGTCLQSLYTQRKIWVAGAILMASIKTDRIQPYSTPTRSDSLQELSSEASAPPIGLVTTHWDVWRDENAGSRKEGILRKSIYGTNKGAGDGLVFRFKNDSESAWKAVDAIVAKFAEVVGDDDTPPHLKSKSTTLKTGERRRHPAGVVGRLVHFIVGVLQRQFSGGSRGR